MAGNWWSTLWGRDEVPPTPAETADRHFWDLFEAPKDSLPKAHPPVELSPAETPGPARAPQTYVADPTPTLVLPPRPAGTVSPSTEPAPTGPGVEDEPTTAAPPTGDDAVPAALPTASEDVLETLAVAADLTKDPVEHTPDPVGPTTLGTGIPPESPRLPQNGITLSQLDTFITDLLAIEGATGAAVVDIESGMALATGGNPGFDLNVAAAGNSNVIRAKLRTMADLNLGDAKIEDILITLSNQYHLINVLDEGTGSVLFVYLVLNRATANLALARHRLRSAAAAVRI